MHMIQLPLDITKAVRHLAQFMRPSALEDDINLPLKDLKLMGGDCLVALLQMETVGPILGAAEYEPL
jgi:hypothetical protein